MTKLSLKPTHPHELPAGVGFTPPHASMRHTDPNLYFFLHKLPHLSLIDVFILDEIYDNYCHGPHQLHDNLLHRRIFQIPRPIPLAAIRRRLKALDELGLVYYTYAMRDDAQYLCGSGWTLSYNGRRAKNYLSDLINGLRLSALACGPNPAYNNP